MRIAFIGNFTRPYCTEQHVAESLRELGHQVRPIQENRVNLATLPRILRSARARCHLLLWTRTWHTPSGPGLRMLSEVHALSVPSVSFHLDRWQGLEREYQVDEEPFFRTDLVVSADGTSEAFWEAHGVNHAWLPPGVLGREAALDPPPANFPDGGHDVIFVGSHPYPHPAWEPIRTRLIDAFAEHYGPRFRVWPDRGHPIRGAQLNALYQSAKVVLGDSCLVPPVARYWCADSETEVLTDRGWLRYDEVTVDDMAYAIDPATGLGRWSAVEAVNVFDAEPREMVSMENRGHSSLTTLDHRWLVESARNVAVNPNPTDRCPECGYETPKRDSPRAISIHRAHAHGVHVPASLRKVGPRVRQFRLSRELGQNDRIPIAAPCQTLPAEPKYSDAFVELVGWVWTEGGWSKALGYYTAISQSHRVNDAYVARIRSCLTVLFGPAKKGRYSTPSWHESADDERGMTTFRVNAAAGRLFADVAADHKVTASFIRVLTAAQLRLFVETSIDGDGCRKTSTKGTSTSTGVTLAQKNPDRLDGFEMACALLGIGTSRSQGAGCWLVHIKRRTFTSPMRRDLPLARVERVIHDGIVWCPTTSEGTWLARRRGTVYFTGNSDRVPETLGRGGFLIHPHVDGIDEWYPDLPTFPVDDPAAAVAVADRWLADEEGRRALTVKQRALVLGRDTYRHRMAALLDLAAEMGAGVS